MGSRSGTWSRIESIYRSARELEGEPLARYLDEICGDDEEIRREVDELLSIPAGSGSLTFAPGDLVAGRFRIVRFLAQGGMGEVYEAEDTETAELVAMKTIRPEFANAATLGRFRRETELARRLRHPALCRNYDVFRHELEAPPGWSFGAIEIFVLSMELLRGETLKERLRRQGPMGGEEALLVMRQVAAGLAAAHVQGIVHRDLKSSNIILVPSLHGERAVVTDFGLARLYNDAFADDGEESGRITMPGELLGTPAYMAPEQMTENEITPATDVYCLGIVMFEMLTGQRPFPGDDLFRAALRLEEDPPSPRALAESLEPWWEEVVLRCLRREPEERYASARELLATLERRGAPPRKLPGWLLAVLFLLLFAGVLFLRSCVAQDGEGDGPPEPAVLSRNMGAHPSTPAPEP